MASVSAQSRYRAARARSRAPPSYGFFGMDPSFVERLTRQPALEIVRCEALEQFAQRGGGQMLSGPAGAHANATDVMIANSLPIVCGTARPSLVDLRSQCRCIRRSDRVAAGKDVP